MHRLPALNQSSETGPAALTAMTFLPAVTVICQHRLTPGIFRAQRWEIIRPDRPLGLNQGHKSTPATSFQSSVGGLEVKTSQWYDRGCDTTGTVAGSPTRDQIISETPLRRVIHWNHNEASPLPHWYSLSPWRNMGKRGEHACNYFTDRTVKDSCYGGDNSAWTEALFPYAANI